MITLKIEESDKTIKSRIDDIIAVQEEVYFKIYMRMKMMIK